MLKKSNKEKEERRKVRKELRRAIRQLGSVGLYYGYILLIYINI